MISYRLKKNELIFLLDFFGDVNTLPQSFGNIYMDQCRCSRIAANLHCKGIINLIDGTASVDTALEIILRRIYTAGVIFTDEILDIWCYCNEDMIVVIKNDQIRKNEYVVTPMQSTEIMKKILENDNNSSEFLILHPFYEKVSKKKILDLISGEII